MGAADTGSRYIIRHKLGRGGMGVVYAAYDSERQVEVALKTVAQLDASSLYLFKREFRSLADVRHPNLVSLYELTSQDETWFFTMELLDGADLLTYVRGERVCQQDKVSSSGEATVGSLPAVTLATAMGYRALAKRAEQGGSGTKLVLDTADESRLRKAFSQLVQGVTALHDSGHLHRDIKPANVQVTSAGRVVLLDFGVIATLQRDGTLEGAGVVGTPAYMAPEQALATTTVGDASDWYSVGVMLYEALAGRRPFEGPLQQLIHDKRSCRPESPQSYHPGVCPELAELCLALLNPEPTERPRAGHILRVLQEHGAGVQSPRPRQRSAVDTTFVGRKQELAVLREAMNAAADGVGTVLYIAGRSGMGKSALVQRFLEEVRALPRSAVLQGRCYQQESVPYKAVDAVVDALGELLLGLDGREVAAQLPEDMPLLVRMFPVLERVRAVATCVQSAPHEEVDPHEVKRRAFGALRELLRRLSAGRPMVVYIDDLQWGDVDSAPLLDGLMRAPEQPTLLLVVSYRSEEREQSPLLQRLFRLAQRQGAASVARELLVNPLEPAQGDELARLLALGSEISVDAAHIAQEAEGHPYFIHELVRHARAGGDRTEGTPLTLDGVIGERVIRLPAEARHMLELVAVAAHPIRLDELGAAAGVTANERMELAQTLQGERLVRTSGLHVTDSIESYHDRIRETVVSLLEPGTLRSHHLSLARALEVAEAAADMVASHYRAAGELVAAVPHAIRAADQSVAALAFGKGAELYQFAIEVLGDTDTERTARLQVKLAEALSNAGRSKAAADAYLAATTQPSSQNHTALRGRAVGELLRSGHLDAGFDVADRLLADLRIRQPRTRFGMLVMFLVHRLVLRVRGLEFEKKTEQEISGEILSRIDACWAIASGLGFTDSVRGAEFQALHLLHALRAGEPTRVARAMAYEIVAHGMWGARGIPAVRERAARARALAAEVDSPAVAGIIGMTELVATVLRGDVALAVEMARHSIPVLKRECAGAWWELSCAEYFEAVSLGYVGRLQEMQRKVFRLVEEAEVRGDLYAVASLSSGTPNLSWVMDGRVQEAAERASDTEARLTNRGFYLQHFWARQALCAVDLYQGCATVAYERWRSMRGRMRRSLLLWVSGPKLEANYLAGRCAVAAAAGASGWRRRALLREASHHVRVLERMRLPATFAVAMTVRAGIAVVRGRPEQVVAVCEQAEQVAMFCQFRPAAMALRRARGLALQGTEGAALVTEAQQWFSGQGVVEPARFAAIYVPELP